MFSNNKFFVASLLLAGTAMLSGCSLGYNTNNTEKTQVTTPTTPVTAPVAAPAPKQQQMDYAYADSQAVLNTAISNKPMETAATSLNDTGNGKESFQHLNTCIKELNALKTLSPKDYNRLVGSFKEVSEINQLYKQVSSTASPDTIELLQMAIEAKTKVLCAKVRYNSVLSTESTLEKISGL
ncbi:hypothetical protein AB7315_03925 [Providencia manganoxydans]|uniref:Lipoprotein n=2 Tax=Providencia TaxID=586 RepID=A0A1S1HTL1_PROST|nr:MULTISPECIES: hypothetical protein [Providencia]ELR5040776.1 hypothetical protein [Providencia stuartii]ELR5083419.1 hypothetical protein [Providencia stuartii]ELR5111968.1 hypothetical protein [Providencia stuartii]MDX4944640.1 hypothetical protein [Providencia manganoxydans]OHT25684.1 hypothetical protein A3Q29_13000 [Providencia stuartii]